MPDEKAVKLPSKNVLAGLIAKMRSVKAKTSEANGELGQAVSKAVDDHNLHAAAFKTAAKLQRMDPVKLNAWLTHFDDYREKLALDDLAAVSLPGLEPMHEADKEGDKAPKDADPAGTGKPAPLSVN